MRLKYVRTKRSPAKREDYKSARHIYGLRFNGECRKFRNGRRVQAPSTLVLKHLVFFYFDQRFMLCKEK